MWSSSPTGFTSVRPYYMQFTMTASPEEFVSIVTSAAAEQIDPMTLIYPKEVPVFDKYDDYLPEELVKKGFACGTLAVDEMRDEIVKLFKNKGNAS